MTRLERKVDDFIMSNLVTFSWSLIQRAIDMLISFLPAVQ